MLTHVQVPEALKGTAVEGVLEKMRSDEYFGAFQRLSTPPHPKYFAFERRVNATFQSAIAAAAACELRLQQAEEEQEETCVQVAVLANTHPKTRQWIDCLTSGET